MGWTWDWPESDGYTVRAYPEIMAGKSPWSSIDTGHGFPVSIETDVTFAFDLDLTADVDAKYNVAPEVWLTTDTTPTSEEIAYEMMIWLDYNDMDPAGEEQTTRYIDADSNISFEVWVKEDHTPSGNTESWTYITLRARTRVQAGTFSLLPMIEHLKSEGIIDSGTYYYAGSELGNELVHGSGASVIRDFDVVVGEPQEPDTESDSETSHLISWSVLSDMCRCHGV